MNGSKYRFHLQRAGGLSETDPAPPPRSPGKRPSGTGRTDTARPLGLPATLAGYACPLHPQWRGTAPGPCPMCGSTLAHLAPQVAAEEAERRDLSRRLWWCLPLTGLVLVMAGAGSELARLSAQLQWWTELVLSVPIVLWGGWPCFLAGARALRRGRPDVWTLVSLSVGAGFLYSLVAPWVFSELLVSFRVDGRVAVHFEAVAIVVSLALFARLMALRARRDAWVSLVAMLATLPGTARRIDPQGSEECVLLAQLQPGDLLRVGPGETIPADGTVVGGASVVDESALTGEARLLPKQPQDKLLGATRNGQGSMIMQVEQCGADGVLAHMVKQVSLAQRSRAPMQAAADAALPRYVMGVLAVAGLTLLVWGRFGPEPGWIYGSLNAVAVLLIACPCAFGLASPISTLVATNRAVGRGILFRDAAAIEDLFKVDTLIVDKAGTLTEGHPVLDRIVAAPGWDETRILQVAASAEQPSNHPLARAMVAEARRRGLALEQPASFEPVPGLGVQALLSGREVAIGNTLLMEEGEVYWEVLASEADAHRQQGATVVFLAVDNKPAGLLVLSDPVKATSAAALKKLRSAGVRVVMATGDATVTAQAVAVKLGIDEFVADARAEHKLWLVKRLQLEGCVVAFAGECAKDMATMAQADVGISMRAGAGLAADAAAVRLVGGDLHTLGQAHDLARRTTRNMRENLGTAFVCNALGVPLATGALYPVSGWLLSPTVAGLAMCLGSVLLILNALRLRTLSW